MTRSERAFISFFWPGLDRVWTTRYFSFSKSTLVTDWPLLCSALSFCSADAGFAFSPFAFSWALARPRSEGQHHYSDQKACESTARRLHNRSSFLNFSARADTQIFGSCTRPVCQPNRAPLVRCK